MDNVKCEYCGKFFNKKRSQIIRFPRHFCSRKCSFLARRKGKIVLCDNCEKEIYKSHKSLQKAKYKKYFCSWSCSNSWLGQKNRGENHPNWNKGRSSYKNALIWSGEKKKCVLCQIGDTRILLAHHIDKNRSNNNISNLCWLCCNCHFLVHCYKSVEESMFNKLKYAKS